MASAAGIHEPSRADPERSQDAVSAPADADLGTTLYCEGQCEFDPIVGRTERGGDGSDRAFGRAPEITARD
jgi:hypothetical protein